MKKRNGDGMVENKLLTQLFLEFDEAQEKVDAYFIGKNIDPHFDHVKYLNGVVIGKFIEGDHKLINIINTSIPLEEIKRVILVSLKNKQAHLLRREQDMITSAKITEIKNEINELDTLSLWDWINKNFSSLFYIVEINDNQLLGIVYVYYAYEEYIEKSKSCYCSEHPRVDEIYKGWFNKDSQYSKYGILPIDEERELRCFRPVRVFDKVKGKTIFTKNISLTLADKFLELSEQKYIKHLAVRVSNEVYDGQVNHQFLLEETERGKVFSLFNLGEPDIVKLYSKNYNDCLWVNIDHMNITFEELCDDFENFGDHIVTQVIHLEYYQSNDTAYISHLDHEYIFYTLDEYEKRLKNVNQKGNARPRIKSFKIDDAKIPFNLKCSVSWKDKERKEGATVLVPFIYFVLEHYFQHKDLLIEYFQNIL